MIDWLLDSNKYNSKQVVFFLKLIIWMKSDKVRAIIEKKYQGEVECHFFPKHLVSKNWIIVVVMHLDFVL